MSLNESKIDIKPDQFDLTPLAPITISPCLIESGCFRFIKVERYGKAAIEKNFIVDKNYSGTEIEILGHIGQGGNYGVLPVVSSDGEWQGIGIDLDVPELEELSHQLPDTFTVRSGRGTPHLYFKVKTLDKPKNLILVNPSNPDENWGNIQVSRKYLVGPSSRHPSGKTYDAIDNHPVAKISFAEIERIFSPYIRKKTQLRRNKTRIRHEPITLELPPDCYPINAIMKGNGEIQGEHPLHGSTGNPPKPQGECTNFTINQQSGVWHCFAHNSGGGALEWIAVREGIISCSEAQPGCLRGSRFNQVRDIARAEGYNIPDTRQSNKSSISAVPSFGYPSEPNSPDRSDGLKATSHCRVKNDIYIQIEKSLEDYSKEALQALIDHNIPERLFVKNARISRIVTDENGFPIVMGLCDKDLRYEVERSAYFWKPETIKGKNGEEDTVIFKPITPPMKIIYDIISMPHYPFPPLVGITECPYMLKNGDLIAETGYNPVTKLFLSMDTPLSLNVPENPTKEDVNKAKEVLNDIFQDFPFVDTASKTNIIAALITHVTHPIIDGLCPLFVVDKSVMGSGASLLADIINIITTGRDAPMTPFPDVDEEMRKKITTSLMIGKSFICFDNCDGEVKSPHLASVLTAQIWEDRVLGQNKDVTSQNRTIWMINGNNIVLSGDLPRRAVYIRIEPETDKPWERTGFKHPDIRAYVKKNRGLILSGILCLVRAWIQAGCPPSDQNISRMGSYEKWQDFIGGTLSYAGYTDFLKNNEQLFTTLSSEIGEWEQFFEVWHNIFGDEPKTTKELLKLIDNENNSAMAEYENKLKISESLPSSVSDGFKRGDRARVFGKQLFKHRDRIFGGFKLISAGKSHKSVLWKVEKIKKGLIME